MKKSVLSLLFILSVSFLFSFEWPQSDITYTSFKSYFGQNRGGVLSTSLVFSEPEEIKIAEDGNILIILESHEDDSDFFPSALGSTVIVAHKDNIYSVYGNLDSESIDKSILKTPLSKGTVLGYSGNSGWQDKMSCLEFQLIDTKINSAINPKLLMPRLNTELPLKITELYLQNKNGIYYNLDNKTNYQNGIYKAYFNRNSVVVPYKISVSVNGVENETIVYNTIVEENGRNSINGKRKYSSDEVYPSDNLQFIGEVLLTSGKDTVTFTFTDILDKSKVITYNLSAY